MRRLPRRRTAGVVAVVAAGAVTLGACGSAEVGDFRNDAENFIDDEDGDVAENLATTFSDAECAEPASTDVGTVFTCTATAADGVTWEFSVEIDGESDYTITTATPTGAAAITPITAA